MLYAVEPYLQLFLTHRRPFELRIFQLHTLIVINHVLSSYSDKNEISLPFCRPDCSLWELGVGVSSVYSATVSFLRVLEDFSG